MNASLPDSRARFLLDTTRVGKLKKLVDPLKDAPLRVRRLGLPLAVATWSREGHDRLVQLLADWLFTKWGMLEGAVPQGAPAFLDRLMDEDESSPTLRSAMEIEAEELLQAAKLISGALTGDTDG
ncbi:MAG: hypothetical protein GXP62_06345 [Oligoflexia bacterium]|nr:hypothetical protein [Oligoflexia bacterium]